MNLVEIETYRGVKILFNTGTSKFHCIASDEEDKESKSFEAVKKFIDVYLQNNANFKPFFITPHPPYKFDDKKLKVIGLRKDLKFVIEDNQGNKKPLPKDYEEDYALYKENNEAVLKALYQLRQDRDKADLVYNTKRKECLNKLDITTLEDFKSELI
ncbi:MAG: hypothetical protein GY775_16810 [Candidatus Scalindua sp.]|nr:hypothetical protein [Candidatus Scalindua sp.]